MKQEEGRARANAKDLLQNLKSMCDYNALTHSN
jgi:hypothetical protein